jgi:hypothetical protein
MRLSREQRGQLASRRVVSVCFGQSCASLSVYVWPFSPAVVPRPQIRRPRSHAMLRSAVSDMCDLVPRSSPCFAAPTVVPPGYLTTPASMAPCPPGTFRQGWLLHSDPGASSCSACGAGIASEPRDLDENPLAANGSLVRATAASCCEFVTCIGM